MRIGDLVRSSGVPLPTIRYYLRAGLLPAGVATAANQAEYGDRHLHRLRLLSALLDVGGLSVAGTQALLAAVDDPAVPLDDLLVLAARAGPTNRLRGLDATELAAVRTDLAGTLDAHQLTPAGRPLDRLVDACAAARRLQIGEIEEALDDYADAAARFAQCDAAVTAAVTARLDSAPNPQATDRGAAVAAREAVVTVAVLSRVIRDALCDLTRPPVS